LESQGKPYIPDNWTRLPAAMGTLTSLVTGAPTSGYFATLFLNLMESCPSASLMPFVVQAVGAWCSAYGVDVNFWGEKNVGPRVCAWLERTLANDGAASAAMAEVQDELRRCLDIMVRSGVAQAREIEDSFLSTRKTA
jgi:hypothetical protein